MTHGLHLGHAADGLAVLLHGPLARHPAATTVNAF